MNNKKVYTRVTRIAITQTSKMAAALYFLFGFLYTFVGLAILATKGLNDPTAILFIVMPVIMGVFGFLFFALFAAVYNLLAKWIGGIEVELTTNEPQEQEVHRSL